MANGRGFATINARWAEEVGEYNWSAKPAPRTTYALTGVLVESRWTTLRLHRLIGRLLGFDPARQVDHKNHDGLDCRDDNLRPATNAQNMRNRRLQRNNTSGVKGVAWHKDGQKWMAGIKVDGKRLHLGLFDDLADAAAAVRAARTRLHGDFACDGVAAP